MGCLRTRGLPEGQRLRTLLPGTKYRALLETAAERGQKIALCRGCNAFGDDRKAHRVTELQ